MNDTTHLRAELIEAIRRQHHAVERLRIYVPELDVDLYFKPYTASERDEISALPMGEGYRSVEFLIRKAEFEDGSKAFTRGDRPLLYSLLNNNMLGRIVDAAAGWIPAPLDPET